MIAAVTQQTHGAAENDLGVCFAAEAGFYIAGKPDTIIAHART